MVYGAIEAGGTKFVCAIGNKDLNVFEKASFPTTTPKETMTSVDTSLEVENEKECKKPSI